MLSHKYILWSILLLFSLSGCQDQQESQSQHDAKIVQQARAELLAELKAKEENTHKSLASQKESNLAHIGITSNEGKIVIDTNKTKKFFIQMAENIKSHAKKFSKDMKKGIIDDKEAGIEMNKTHINIDLNKTKSFLDSWSKKIEAYAKEFDTITKDLDINKQKDNNAAN